MDERKQKDQGAPPAQSKASRKKPPTIRYVANGVDQPQPLTARELRDWQGRVEIGDYTIRPVDGNRSGSGRDAWNLFLKTSVGTWGPVEMDGFVEEFATFRDALAAARKGARKDAALRGSSRGSVGDAAEPQS